MQPSSLHQDTLYADVYADGKLFNTITNGVRKMPGYSAQIPTRDRWAIVAYVPACRPAKMLRWKTCRRINATKSRSSKLRCQNVWPNKLSKNVTRLPRRRRSPE